MRRQVRKTELTVRSFDDVHWPIDAAFIVLGGFTVGVALSFFRFDDSLWYRNAWAWLIAVPVFIFCGMYISRRVSQAWLRRSMQFGLVLSLLFHLFVVLVLIETKLRGVLLATDNKMTAEFERVEQTEQVVPEFRLFEFIAPSHERPEFEQPVETEVPTPVVELQEPSEVDQSPIEPQPQPVEHPEETARPTLAKHDEQYESVPRRSEHTSRISRNMDQRRLTSPTAPAPAGDSVAESADVPEPADTATLRQQLAAADPQSMPEQQQSVSALPMQRSAIADAPQSPAQSALEVQRESSTARILPSVDAQQLAESATQNAAETALAPPSIDIARRSESGSMTRSEEDAFQELGQQSPTTERRANNVNETPTVAQTPEPVPNREPRLTTRPTVGLLPQAEDVAATSETPPTTTSLSPANSSVSRAVAASAMQPTHTNPVDVATAAPTTVNERSSSTPSVEAPSSIASSQPTRTEITGQISEQQPAALSEPTTANDSVGDLAAANSPIARRAAASGVEVASPSSLDAASQPNVAVDTERTSSGSTMTPAPESAQPLAIDRQQSEVPQIPSAALANSISPSRSPTPATGGIRPTDSSVGRQAATATEDSSRQPAETLTHGQQPQIARTESQRLLASSEPTLNPLERPTERPSRSQDLAEAPQSPTVAASPANQITTEQSPVLGPAAAMALSRGSSGVAGTGYSPNLDRQAPAGESPALTSSGSSRQRATSAEEGPALSPMSRAEVARSRAGELRPSASMQASAGSAGTVPAGDVEVGPAATASAAATDLSARAERGDVSADMGSVQVDMGPQRVVSQFQQGRGSGGGGEVLNLAPTTGNGDRPQRSSTGEIGINVANAAPAAAAPAGDGGSRPLAIDANPAATNAQRTDGGGSDSTSGGPAVAEVEGPTIEPNASDIAGDLAVRGARNIVLDVPAGGGTGTSGQAAGEPGVVRQSLGRAGPATDASAPSPAPVAGAVATADNHRGAEAGPTAASVGISGPAAGRSQDDVVAASTNFGNVEQATSDRGAPASAIAARRSEAVDAPAGTEAIGGGSATVQRQSQSASISPDQSGLASAGSTDTIVAPGDARSSGPAASGVAIAQQAGGISSGEAGPLSDSSTVVSTPTIGPIRAGGGAGGNTSVLAQPSTVGGSTSARAPTVASIQANPAEPAGPSGLPPGEPDGEEGVQESQLAIGPSSTGADVSFPVDIDVPVGEGGLGSISAPDVGLDDRRASRDTEQIQTSISRLPRQEVGGRPQFNPAAVVAPEAFRKRLDRTAPGQGGARLTPESERSIELGLVFLARHQREDGRWSLQGFDRERPAIQSDAAATGLALLAFQGAGYTHVEQRYAEQVRKALDFLIANQNVDGLVFAPADDESNRFAQLYTHAIAALAMCEAYGMTQDPSLREPAQRAIDYIVATQHAQLGGWRYAPQVSSDTSVSGWMMMAMKSGELAGLTVPQTSYDGIMKWLNAAQASQAEPHMYRYNPYAEDNRTQGHGRNPSKTMTAVGLLMRLYTGWRRDNQNMQRGAAYLLENLPTIGGVNEPILQQRRDTYYWYYATQVVFHMGGDAWRKWNATLHPLLVDSQIQEGELAGSWDPLLPVPDRWAGQAGRLYVTTMNLLSLEVSYRHLPLYEDTAR